VPYVRKSRKGRGTLAPAVALGLRGRRPTYRSNRWWPPLDTEETRRSAAVDLIDASDGKPLTVSNVARYLRANDRRIAVLGGYGQHDQIAI